MRSENGYKALIKKSAKNKYLNIKIRYDLCVYLLSTP
jgi:hypothetical protein